MVAHGVVLDIYQGDRVFSFLLDEFGNGAGTAADIEDGLPGFDVGVEFGVDLVGTVHVHLAEAGFCEW